MSVTIYVPSDNGDLKYLADVGDEDRPDMALDAVLDAAEEDSSLKRKVRNVESFVALVGTMESGALMTLTVGDEEPVQRPRRNIQLSSNGAVAETEADDEEQEEEDEEEPEEEQPKPAAKRTARKRTGSTRSRSARSGADDAPKRRTARKASSGTKRVARKSSSGGKSAPFKRNAKSDE